MSPSNLSPDRWDRVSEILLRALEVSIGERVEVVDRLCADDESLKREVLVYLEEHDSAGVGFLAPLDSERVGQVLGTGGETPKEIGPYRVIDELGRGGMGVVYRAERIDGHFEQEVALKLIKRGMDSDAIEQRFLYERQILARLQHPNIARLLDGSVTDEGQPYFAMEYVDGVSITRYCDAKMASIEERLDLFAEVGSAIQYAHANLVVHRDLKPSNMLVDTSGRVKLLDFGIAKVLGGDQEAAPLTMLGVRVMTPEYAAPEQLRGQQVTTATDVYALGSVLYELLTGHRPGRSTSLSPEAGEGPVGNDAMLAPSSVVFESTELISADGSSETLSPSTLGNRRSLSVEKLHRRLSGDLDAIVLKALREEPERRYVSVEALLQDIERHRLGLPVSAQRESVRYRTSKFVQRHRAGVLAALLVLLSLTGGLGTALWQAARANRERDLARLEAEKSKQVASFMANLFQTSDPAISRGDEITVREMLDSGAGRTEHELSGQPEVKAQMMDAIGRAYFGLGLYDKAKPMLEASLELRQQTADVDELDVAESYYALGYLLHQEGDFENAERHYRSSLEIRRDHLGDRQPELVKGMNGLAFALRGKGDFVESEKLYREALELGRQLLEEDDPEVAVSVNGLAAALRGQGKTRESEPFSRQALALNRAIHGDDHPYVSTSLFNLAVVLHEQEKYEEAKVLYEETIRLESKLLGEQHPAIAIDLRGLGNLYYDIGDLVQAEASLTRALAIQRETLPERHTRAASTLISLGRVYITTGRAESALGLIEQALSIRQESLVAGNWQIGEAIHTLGLCYVALGRHEEAEHRLLEGYAIVSKARGSTDSHTLKARRNLFDFYQATTRPEEAAKYSEGLGDDSGQ